jgi:HlyD family secretion protein
MMRLGIAVALLLMTSACAGNQEAGFTGYIEAELLLVGAEAGGRLVELGVDEGDRVRASAPLFAVDADRPQANLAQAAARVVEAEARLADARSAQQRPIDIAVLAAAVERAEAALALSERDYERHRVLAKRGFVAQARLDAARSALDRDRASLDEAQRRIAQARQPARSAQIEAAQAALAQARAAFRETEIGVDQLRVAAPAAGTIEQVYFRTGEVVSPGQPVVALLPPGRLKVRFFVPEVRLADARVGRIVAVTCDGCPADLKARIGFVAREAEFTPPVILSRDERDRLVFMVEAQPIGAAARLSAGQPVEVAFTS